MSSKYYKFVKKKPTMNRILQMQNGRAKNY